MKSAKERFLKYIQFNTQSNETSDTYPSSDGQRVFARFLTDELKAAGLSNVRCSDFFNVYAEIPASNGLENIPVLGLIAHMDTSSAASGENIKPSIIEYQGGIIPLGTAGKVLDPKIFPKLDALKGKHLIVTDGTTLLGADDKAGLAEIIAAAEQIIISGIPHGKICFAFTPDEEIGRGTKHFDVKGFGADFAFTMDGGRPDAIEYQNFNAAEASIEFNGISVHPGQAKDIMINALKVAVEFDSMLPPGEIPEKTSGTEGFYHLINLSGTVSKAEANYILRDHNAGLLNEKKQTMIKSAEALNKKYGENTVILNIRDQYKNMEEVICRYPFLIDMAKNAIREAGLEPVIVPIRGGTDGANLSFMGLPCPNLGTGGYNYHGEYEFLVLEEMDIAVEIILSLVQAFAGGGASTIYNR